MIMKKKDFPQILHEAREKLPEAKGYKGDSCIVEVFDGVENVKVEFSKYTRDKPSGWQGGRIKKE